MDCAFVMVLSAVSGAFLGSAVGIAWAKYAVWPLLNEAVDRTEEGP